MIGNDIVSLDEARLVEATRRPRYIQKVLVESEQQFVLNSNDPELYFWMCWALKESAYKLDYKTEHKHYFGPKKIICSEPLQAKKHNEQSNDHSYSAIVKTPLESYWGSIKVTDKLIHAVCYKTHLSIENIYFDECVLTDKTAQTQSQEVRQFLKNSIAKNWIFNADQLVIKKTLGYPIAYQHHKNIDIDISLSHHANLGGVAFLKSV